MIVTVLVVLTVVNLGVSATWWVRSGEPVAARVPTTQSSPRDPVASRPSPRSSAPSSSRSGTGSAQDTATTGIPAAEAPSGTPAPASEDLARTWTAPADMPTTGLLLHVDIPGVRSHFPARRALLYLPPAALTADPPDLPVAVLLSGQSRGAGPTDVEDGGHIAATADALAMTHRGLAPIVVVPDQLGPDSGNPLCVDGPLGNSRTYLEDDVPAWVTAHLRVQSGPSAWTIGGFSQGGTCAIQIGAGDPGRFGNLIDVSGEAAPSRGTVATTVAEGFDGDVAAYRAAVPAAVLAEHTPYRSSDAFFAVGQDDRVFGPVMPVMARAAQAAGMHVDSWVVPGGGHNWTTAAAVLAAGLSWETARIGLAPA